MREITLETKIADLLQYPGMKDTLIGINPKFKKLNNPVLRRTIAKVTSVKQAAIVGGMDPMDLLSRLRASVGQGPVCDSCTDPSEECLLPQQEPRPSWADTEPRVVLDANELLDNDQNPLAVATKELSAMDQEDILVIKSDFRPEPLVDEFLKKGHTVYVDELSEESFMTLIKKS